MRKEKTVTKLCVGCKKPFTFVKAVHQGRHYEYVKGWHNRKYCNDCIPEGLYYKNRDEYMIIWHNLRASIIYEDETADNSV